MGLRRGQPAWPVVAGNGPEQLLWPGHAAPGKQRRVLVVDHDDLFVGLLVDEVLGLQHFTLDSLQLSPPQPLIRAAARFVQGHFPRERNWAIFSPFALAQAPGFLDVAL